MSRRALIAPACLLVGLFALAGCTGDAAPNETASEVQRVDVGAENIATVKRGRVESGPTISGTLTAQKTATVRAQISSTVTAMSVEVGQRVTVGTMLARLDDRALRDVVTAAQSALKSAQRTLENAQRELTRQERLLAIEAVAQKEVDTARATYDSAVAAVTQAQSTLTNAEQQLTYASIVAPFSGSISDRAISLGDVVQAGSTLFTIVDPSTMRLEGSVLAESLTALKVGANVTFSVRGYPNQEFAGRITGISPSADASTRQVTVFASLPNRSSSLVAGLFASGRVVTTMAEGLVIPVAALDAREQVPAVVRVRNGVAERIQVELGLRDEASQQVVVRSGLNEGDTLLTGSAQQVDEGTRIALVGDAAYGTR